MIVFFIRRANDIDHVTPVIWAMARASAERVLVLSLNPYLPLHGDYRLDFLRTLSNVTLDYVYTVAPRSPWRAAFVRTLCADGPAGKALRALAVARFWDGVRRRLFDEAWAERLLANLGADLLVFDWVKPDQHVTRELLTAAARLRLPTVALPHGVSITTGEFRTRAAARAGGLPDYAHAFPFDWFVAPHADHAEYFARGGMSRERMAVLGSARFCDEWVRQGRALAPSAEAHLGPSDGRLKVLFLDKDSYSLRPEAVRATNLRLQRTPSVRLVVKPQTRNNALSYAASGVEVVPDLSSVSLIAWADVVVGTVSSVLLEPLCAGTPLVYPAHHVGISSRLQELGACWEVHDDDELVAAVSRLRRDPASYRVPAARIGACLTELVYAGEWGRDVLAGYRAFLNSRRHTAEADVA